MLDIVVGCWILELALVYPKATGSDMLILILVPWTGKIYLRLLLFSSSQTV
jgi:hypothetical protein